MNFPDWLANIGHGIVATIIWGVIAIFLFILVFLLYYVLNNLAELFAALAKKNEIHAKIMEQGTLESRTNNALNVLNVINALIDLELASQAEAHKATKQQFNQLRIDEDVRELCNIVHKSIDMRVFSANNEMILSAEYIEKYITLTVTTKILNVYRDTNIAIAEMLAAQQSE